MSQPFCARRAPGCTGSFKARRRFRKRPDSRLDCSRRIARTVSEGRRIFDIDPSVPPGGDSPGANVPDYVIQATVSLQERPPRTLKHGHTFAVFDRTGDLAPGEREADGLY